MSSKTKVTVYIAALLLLILSVGIFKIKKNCAPYGCVNFPESSKWKVSEVYEETKTSWRGLIKHPDYNIRMHKVVDVSSSDSEQLTKISTMNIMGLFDTARSPYPGVISDKIVCSEEFKPQTAEFLSKSGVKINFLSAFLNDRMQYGSCTKDQAVNHAFTGVFYCSDRQEWYSLEIIVPEKEVKEDGYYKSLFNGLEC